MVRIVVSCARLLAFRAGTIAIRSIFRVFFFKFLLFVPHTKTRTKNYRLVQLLFKRRSFLFFLLLLWSIFRLVKRVFCIFKMEGKMKMLTSSDEFCFFVWLILIQLLMYNEENQNFISPPQHKFRRVFVAMGDTVKQKRDQSW